MTTSSTTSAPTYRGNGGKRAAYQFKKKDDLRSIPPMRWKVKRILPESGLAVVYGRPGVGKSFLLLDLACAVASGQTWFGYKTVASPVIYLCLEGAAGFASRIRAWEVGHKRELPENLYLLDAPFNFLNTQDVGALIRAVDALCKTIPEGLGTPLVIVDTLNRAMVGGDENSSRDMSLLWQACGHLTAATGGLVILNHHPGKDAERGPRGHSSVTATVDASIVVTEAKGLRSWKSDKVKDGPKAQPVGFELCPIVLSVDEDGEEVTSCYVEVDSEDAVQSQPLSVHAQLFLDMLQELEATGGTVKTAMWRAQCIDAVAVNSDSGKRNAFNRAKRELCERNRIHIAEKDGLVCSVG